MVKFNYVNRKSEGVKLGQIVAKDLLKRIPPGSSYKSALRDACVDLDVTGKALTDEGFTEVAEALTKTIQHQDKHGMVVVLEEIGLRGNKLTASSLRLLGRVVSLAAWTLKDLDISENLICISTADDAAAWEEFLGAFSRCCILRRVNFSGNSLGPKAFEILARVYGREETEDTLFATTFSVFAATTSLDGHARKGKETQAAGKRSLVSNMFHYSQTKGLRSVPYLVFIDTAMTDVCALHLSHIISYHDTPLNLLEGVSPAKAGLPAQLLEAYDRVPGCQGIIYRPDDTIGAAGTRVLEFAELDRTGCLREAPEELAWEEFSGPITPTKKSREGSVAQEVQTPQSHHRRRSTLSKSFVDDAGHSSYVPDVTDLRRARSRIQGDTLRDFGVRSNDLWQLSLKMLSLARLTLLDSSKLQVLKEQTELTYAEVQRFQRTASSSSQAPSTTAPSASNPLKPGNPNKAMFPRLPQCGKESLSMSVSASTSITTPTREKTSEHPRRPKLVKHATSFRSQLLGGLKEHTWGHIICLACDCVGIVGTDQSAAIVKWASDRGTLERELRELGKTKNVQIWKVLSGMECLAYEMRI